MCSDIHLLTDNKKKKREISNMKAVAEFTSLILEACIYVKGEERIMPENELYHRPHTLESV